MITDLKDHFQRILLFILGFLPPLFVLPGKTLNHYSFTLYREPKLYLIGALGWLLLTLGRPRRSIVGASLAGMGILALVSVLWAPVKEAVIYEVFQYVNLVVLSVVLADYFQLKRLRLLFLCGIVTGMAIVVLIGLCQWQGIHFPVLIPVGIEYPSTFGARHSAGLAVCGSMFLTLIPLSIFFKKKKYLLSVFLTLLFLLQLFYLFILGSRTAYFGLMLGVLGSLTWLRYLKLRFKKLVILIALLLSFIASSYAFIGLSNNVYVRNRLKKTLVFFYHPSAFFETERWIWWSNSFRMFKANPMGVGAGNWGFLYPVYRKSGRFVYYTEQRQVRRTHNDYIQILCELGPCALLIFLFLIFKSLKQSWQTFYRDGSMEAAFLYIQLCSWTGLMFFDYPFEMPYQRFLLVIVLLLIEGNYHEQLV